MWEKSVKQKRPPNLKKALCAIFEKIPYEILLVLTLFFATRIPLTASGIFSRRLFSKVYDSWYVWKYDKHQWLDIWSVWDSGWYLNIAEYGYSPFHSPDLPQKVAEGQSNVGFFPLYPMLIRISQKFVGNFHTAGILISNICLFLSGIFLYKLIELDSNSNIAKLSLIFLFFFPTSFVLSGIFSESLFLLLSILSFYYAKKNKWRLSGIFGFLLALTRPTGVLALIPLVYLYVKQNKFRYDKRIFWLLLYPAGIIVFFLFLYILTGDFLAYIHSKSYYWGTTFSNPFSVIINFLFSSDAGKIISVFIISELFLIIKYAKRIPFEYIIFSFSLVVVALFNGTQSALAIPRMSGGIFPIFPLLSVALSRIKTNEIKISFLIFIFLLQNVFMMLWSVGVLII